MKNFSSGGNTDLFLTREQKIVAMNGFRCFTHLDAHFQIRHFFKNNNLKFYATGFVMSFFVTSLWAILRISSA